MPAKPNDEIIELDAARRRMALAVKEQPRGGICIGPAPRYPEGDEVIVKRADAEAMLIAAAFRVGYLEGRCDR